MGLNSFLKDMSSNRLYFLYGEAASGKTTIIKIACIDQIKRGKRVLFIDAERGFSIDRFKQLAGENYKDYLKNLLLIKVNSFKDQQIKIKNLEDFIKKQDISLVALDTMSYYYRTLFKSKPDLAKAMLISQLKILKNLSKKMPVLITSQVYKDIKKNKIRAVAYDLINNYPDRVIRLEKNPRMFIMEKPKDEKITFDIVDQGILFS
nr:hypothetical protein [Candidatus Woesearchaeota archaeon]